MDELKPCPFCGKSPVTSPSGEGGKGLMVECLTEGCVNPHTSYYDHASAIRTWNTRAASGGDSLVSKPAAPHAANNAISPTVRATVGSFGLNEPFGNPEQFSVNEPSGDSRQFASLEQRARRLPVVPQAFFDEFGESADDRVMDYGQACYDAALANQQGVEKDAERYRWLRDNCFINQHDDRDFPHAVIMVQWFDGEHVCRMHPGHHPGVGIPGLDSAIDAAMSTQPAGDVGRQP